MERNPYSSPVAAVADHPSPVTGEIAWSKVLPIWWSFIWRSSVYGFIGGAVLGGVAGGILGATGHLDKARIAGMLAGYIAGIGLSTLALKQALQRHLTSLLEHAASI